MADGANDACRIMTESDCRMVLEAIDSAEREDRAFAPGGIVSDARPRIAEAIDFLWAAGYFERLTTADGSRLRLTARGRVVLSELRSSATTGPPAPPPISIWNYIVTLG